MKPHQSQPHNPQRQPADAPYPNTVDRVTKEIYEILGGGKFEVVYQPIIDFGRGDISAYEALSRFPGIADVPPDVVFQRAMEIGCGPELEMLAVRRARERFQHLHPGTALAVNLCPETLLSEFSKEALAGNLSDLIIEVTEHSQFGDPTELRGCLDQLRARGAVIAVDDAGSGYSGMKTLIELRPDIIKLDRSLIAGIERESVKYYLVTMLAELADRIGSTLLAEGVEHDGELVTVMSLGVPLGQGWLFGKPSSSRQVLDMRLHRRLQSLKKKLATSGELAQILETTQVVNSDEEPTTSGWVNVICDRGVPHGMWIREVGSNDRQKWARKLSVQISTIDDPIEEVVVSAMGRDASGRYDPIIFVDPDGSYLGIGRIERLVGLMISTAKGRRVYSTPDA